MIETKTFEVKPEDSQFKMVFVDLTHRCNMNCFNCYLPNRTIPDMDFDKMMDTLSRLPKSVDIRLIGAEPTLREDLPTIIKSVLKLGHRVSVVTNGLKLADLDYCKTLRDAGLKVVNISINGADDDELYKLIDGGKYAKLKEKAVENSLAVGFRVGTGTIISKGINELAITKAVNMIVRVSKKLNLKYSDKGYAPLLRFKNIGAIGRYQTNGQMSFDDLLLTVCSQLHIPHAEIKKNLSARGTIYIRPIEQAKKSGYHISEEPRSYYWQLETEVGNILILINDWDTKDQDVPDAGNLNRGRITKNWTIAPFFEDVKNNEFGY